MRVTPPPHPRPTPGTFSSLAIVTVTTTFRRVPCRWPGMDAVVSPSLGAPDSSLEYVTSPKGIFEAFYDRGSP